MWESSELNLEPGSMVVLYTDGLIEQDRDVVASTSSLLAASERFRSASDPAEAICAALLPQQHALDDVAILTMRSEVKAPGTDPARMSELL